MTDETDWEEYSKHCETALQRAKNSATSLGDQCQEKFRKGHSPIDQARAETAYWLADMIDELRRDMRIGPGYEKEARRGPTYWRAHAYIAWGKNDAANVQIHQLKERIRILETDLDLERRR